MCGIIITEISLIRGKLFFVNKKKIFGFLFRKFCGDSGLYSTDNSTEGGETLAPTRTKGL